MSRRLREEERPRDEHARVHSPEDTADVCCGERGEDDDVQGCVCDYCIMKDDSSAGERRSEQADGTQILYGGVHDSVASLDLVQGDCLSVHPVGEDCFTKSRQRLSTKVLVGRFLIPIRNQS